MGDWTVSQPDPTPAVFRAMTGLRVDQFAALAARALEPKPEPEVALHHIHAPAVSVREQAALVVDRLRRTGTMTFRSLCGDSPDTLTTVARFLSLLELFRVEVEVEHGAVVHATKNTSIHDAICVMNK